MVDPATYLHWRSEPAGYCCVLRRYRCSLQPPINALAEDQSITVQGMQGPHAHLNGAYVVVSVNPGTITP